MKSDTILRYEAPVSEYPNDEWQKIYDTIGHLWTPVRDAIAGDIVGAHVRISWNGDRLSQKIIAHVLRMEEGGTCGTVNFPLLPSPVQSKLGAPMMNLQLIRLLNAEIWPHIAALIPNKSQLEAHIMVTRNFAILTDCRFFSELCRNTTEENIRADVANGLFDQSVRIFAPSVDTAHEEIGRLDALKDVNPLMQAYRNHLLKEDLNKIFEKDDPGEPPEFEVVPELCE